MNNLVKHLFDNNFDEILQRSLLNCHVKGLHSIMLSEHKGATIRLYVADTNHELYVNNEFDILTHDLSIAFHPHHCNLTLECVKGQFLNWEVKESDKGIKLNKFLYHSAIIEGKTHFELIDENSHIETLKNRFVNKGECVMMKAEELHTVAVEKGKVAAWLVYEGKEDEKYSSYCWSNADLTNQDFSGLYGKPTKEDIFSLLKIAGFEV